MTEKTDKRKVRQKERQRKGKKHRKNGRTNYIEKEGTKEKKND